MRLTVIPSDNIIIKDGERLVFSFAAPADLHAIQWYGTHGFVETTDGKQVRTDDQADVQAYIDAYAAEVARLAAIAATPKTLKQVRTEKLAALDAARKAAETAQVTVQGKPFPGTDEFQAKIGRALNYIGRGKPLDLADAWRDSNAAPVAMNATLLGQIEDAITAQGVAAWKKYWTLFDAVMAAQDAATVEAVTW